MLATLTASEALSLVRILLSLALLQQGLEFLLMREAVSDTGVWRWSDLKEDFAGFTRVPQMLLGTLFVPRNFILLIVLQCAFSVLLPWFPMLILPLFFIVLLINVRWRGTFNGGSDSMTLILLTSLVLQMVFGDSVKVSTLCAWYICFHVCCSYFIAGIVKMREPTWRSGIALQRFLACETYSSPVLFRKMTQERACAMALSWVMMIFELSFPLALLNHSVCLVYVTLGLIFHTVNVYALGLNRFLWAWAASYPALYFAA